MGNQGVIQVLKHSMLSHSGSLVCGGHTAIPWMHRLFGCVLVSLRERGDYPRKRRLTVGIEATFRNHRESPCNPALKRPALRDPIHPRRCSCLLPHEDKNCCRSLDFPLFFGFMHRSCGRVNRIYSSNGAVQRNKTERRRGTE